MKALQKRDLMMWKYIMEISYVYIIGLIERGREDSRVNFGCNETILKNQFIIQFIQSSLI